MSTEKQIALSGRLRGVLFSDSKTKVGQPPIVAAPPVAPTTSAADAAEREHFDRIMTSLREAAGALRSREAEYLHAMQQLTMELSVAIASKLLHEQIETGSFPIETLVRQVAERLEAKQPMTVHLHPADLALLRKRTGGELFPANVEIEFVADPLMARGDCKATAGDVTVLANLEDQLADIRQSLLRNIPEPAVCPFPEKRQSA